MPKTARFALVMVLAVLIPIAPYAIIGELPGERWLSAADDNATIFGMTGMALLAGDVLLPIPSSIIGTALGARLGFMPGWLWAWLGMNLGNLVGYMAGHLWPARMSEKLPAVPTQMLLFLSRPVPVLAEAATLVAGANRLALLPFLLACTLGNACYAAALALNGAIGFPAGLVGFGLVLPMSLPVLAWLAWRWWESKHNAPSV